MSNAARTTASEGEVLAAAGRKLIQLFCQLLEPSGDGWFGVASK